VDVVAANVEEILEKKASTVFEEISRDDLSEIQGGAARPGGEPKPFSAEELNKPVPKAKGQGGPKRRLDKDERLAVIKIVGALERVSQSDAATAEEIKSAVETALPTRRVKNLTRELRGWTEIDVLPDNPGWNNTMRVLYKVKNDVWQLRLLDMHGVTELY